MARIRQPKQSQSLNALNLSLTILGLLVGTVSLWATLHGNNSFSLVSRAINDLRRRYEATVVAPRVDDERCPVTIVQATYDQPRMVLTIGASGIRAAEPRDVFFSVRSTRAASDQCMNGVLRWTGNAIEYTKTQCIIERPYNDDQAFLSYVGPTGIRCMDFKDIDLLPK